MPQFVFLQIVSLLCLMKSCAVATILPRRLSPSSLECFRQCPQLFKYRYVDKLPEPTSTALARGISAHDALQKLFDLDPLKRTEAVLHDLFRASWSKMRKTERYMTLFSEGERDAEREWGLESLALLSDYFELESPADTHPLMREQRFTTWLATSSSGDETFPSFELVGVIDRVDRDAATGELQIVDYKTGKAPKIEKYALSTQARIIEDKFFQLRIYALLLSRSLDELPATLRILFLGSCEEVASVCDAKAVERTEAEVVRLWQAMNDSATRGSFEPKEGPLCAWCHHRDKCPAFHATSLKQEQQQEVIDFGALPLPPF